MLKFLKRVLFFCLAFSLAYPLFVVLWGEYASEELKKNMLFPIGTGGHIYLRLQEVKKTKDVDILFLGSSHAYRGFDNRIFAKHGFKTFNLGTSSQTPIQTNVLLKRYLKQLRPKLVVYEVWPSTFTNEGIEAAIGLMANDIIDAETFKMVLKLKNIKCINTFIYALYRKSIGKDTNFKAPFDNEVEKYVNGGYSEYKLLKDPDRKMPDRDSYYWDESLWQISYFEENLKILRGIGAQIILVQAPVRTSKYLKRKKTNTIVDTYFKSKAPYYNFNKIIKLNDSLNFWDDDHMNRLGVAVFNERFIETLFNDSLVISSTKKY